MPLIETESLVLRSYNLAEADRIVVFFTRDHGIVRGVAKGAKRLKSRFGSTLEVFSTVNLAYFHKEDRELVSVQHVELERSRFSEASSPEFLESFSYIADLLIALVPPHDPSEVIYRMTKACLDSASEKTEDFAAIRLYFELWLLRLGGYLPTWTSCSGCGRGLISSDDAFLRHDSSLLCNSCRRDHHLTPISVEQRELFLGAQRMGPADFIERANPVRASVTDLSRILGQLVRQAAGRDLAQNRLVAANT